MEKKTLTIKPSTFSQNSNLFASISRKEKSAQVKDPNTWKTPDPQHKLDGIESLQILR